MLFSPFFLGGTGSISGQRSVPAVKAVAQTVSFSRRRSLAFARFVIDAFFAHRFRFGARRKSGRCCAELHAIAPFTAASDIGVVEHDATAHWPPSSIEHHDLIGSLLSVKMPAALPVGSGKGEFAHDGGGFFPRKKLLFFFFAPTFFSPRDDD